jgi:hypothetical protein
LDHEFGIRLFLLLRRICLPLMPTFRPLSPADFLGQRSPKHFLTFHGTLNG